MNINGMARIGLVCVSALGVLAASPAAAQKTQVVIGATSNIASFNPYADSASQMYSIWYHVYGCLCRYDFDKGDYEPVLAERWENDPNDRNVWTFHLRRDIRSHSGAPLTAEDVVHTYDRIRNDRQSAQKAQIAPIVRVVAVDAHTVRLVTKEPTAPLLQYVCDSQMISRKAVFDQHGARDADRKHPDGFGPYRLVDLTIGERVVLEKVPGHPLVSKDNPDVLMWRRMQEVEQRVTALLNGEIQIAQFIPPHLMKRVADNPRLKLAYTDTVEIMMLVMNPKFKPWENKLLRRAVAHAIDREAIIKTILNGLASPLHGPIGKGQIGFDPERAKAFVIPYDPEKARALVREAGYPNGVDVELFTATGRYVNDKQVAEAVTAMLTKVGIRTRLHTPEYATHWPNVQKGRSPFYYQGRGSMIDPSVAIAQYFETGITPRTGYSNPAFDALMRQERQEFDTKKRQKLLNDAFAILIEDMPAHFMWRHRLVDGMARTIDYQPLPHNRVYGNQIRVRAN